MSRITLSVHGNAFCSEQLYPLIGSDSGGGIVHSGFAADWGIARGWGRTFRMTGWYHVAIPCVTHFDGAGMFLEEVLIHCEPAAAVADAIHVWEGGTFLWSGASVVPGPNDVLVRPRESSSSRFLLRVGVGVSMHFTISDGGSVWFKSASVTLDDRPI